MGRDPNWPCWNRARPAAYRECCEVCGFVFKLAVTPTRGAIDHVCPRVMCVGASVSPHDSRNLMCLCLVCHGIKCIAERFLRRGNRLRFEQMLNKHGWPMERVDAAFALYMRRIP